MVLRRVSSLSPTEFRVQRQLQVQRNLEPQIRTALLRERLRRLNAPAATTEEAIAPAPRATWLAALFGPRRVPFDTLGRGANFLQIGMLEAARRELRQALLTPDQPEPALVKMYVIATARLGRVEESRAWCTRLVEISPQDTDALALLASLKNGS